METPTTRSPASSRRHTGCAFLALTIAAGYLLSRFELVYSPRGFAYGASATDLRIVAPILLVNATLMIILAIAFIYNYFRFNWRPIAVVFGLWLPSIFCAQRHSTRHLPTLRRFFTERRRVGTPVHSIQYRILRVWLMDLTRFASRILVKSPISIKLT